MKEVKNLQDVIKHHRLTSDADLERLEKLLPNEGLVLLREYRLCRSLLGQALDQRGRLMNWVRDGKLGEAASGKGLGIKNRKR